jgi:hypothetical protein
MTLSSNECYLLVVGGGPGGSTAGSSWLVPVRDLSTGRRCGWRWKDPAERFAIDRIHAMVLRTFLAPTSFVAAVMWTIWAQAEGANYGPSSLQPNGAAGSTRRALL